MLNEVSSNPRTIVRLSTIIPLSDSNITACSSPQERMSKRTATALGCQLNSFTVDAQNSVKCISRLFTVSANSNSSWFSTRNPVISYSPNPRKPASLEWCIELPFNSGLPVQLNVDFGS